jgi:hypothetical protein
MSSAGVDAILFQETPSPVTLAIEDGSTQSCYVHDDRFAHSAGKKPFASGPRRTPRKSLIVVLPDNHVVSPDLVSGQLAVEGHYETDVIVACAGQPAGIAALQRRIRDLQVLLAPAGTPTEDLRELAMNQALGDIVTLLSGVPA